jgi:hypothetical protein
MIGVDDRGNYKFHCPSCYLIILKKKKEKNIFCPECQYKKAEEK